MAGIIIGSYGKLFSMSPGTRLALTHFWEVIVFIINSLLFLLIGIDLESPNLVYHASTIGMVFGFMMLVRFLFTLGFGLIMRAVNRPWPMSWQMVIFWGGLRGSIPIALTLGLPVNYPHRLDMVSIIFGVVLLSLLSEGLTFKGVLRFFNMGRASLEELQLEELCGRLMGVHASIVAIEKSRHDGILPLALYTYRLQQLEEHRTHLDAALEKLFKEHPELRDTYLNRLDRDLIRSRLAALDEGLRKGILKKETVERLAEELETCLLEPHSCQSFDRVGPIVK
jgi:CPA1 family monovalent cation:H+ antiporter